MSEATIITDQEVSETIDQALNELRRKVAIQQALDSLRRWLSYARSKREEWFEVEDREMYAYHRGYERGLERGIAAIEAALDAASVDLK
ncbi:MAG TPA: hypothetical protein VFS96_07305 [Nitrolancea sp.]|nr:hypothetical protein [Nitrolancea sp.]